jgi:16S rRNA (cytosine1402-N4)-methyltransferase
MSREIISYFSETGKHLFVDCTVGMGGHTYQILRTFPGARVLAVDVDPESIDRARTNLADYADRLEFHCFNFVDLFEHVDLSGLEVSGILVDPGLSMDQLKGVDRGFSHNLDAPLDMRKDRRSGLTAAEIVNTYTESQLSHVFQVYGELPNPQRLAKKIIERRLRSDIVSTAVLKEVVENTYGKRVPKGKSHPAARVFQALRIEVNGELEGISGFLEKIPRMLNAGLRVAFLTYHSLEDRIVKQTYRLLKAAGKIQILNPFPAFPSDEEIGENPASRSARLRVAEVL